MRKTPMNSTCPFCGAPVLARSRFCSNCGRPLRPSSATPVELALPSRRVRVQGDSLDVRELVNVVESGVRVWQQQLASADLATREQAARAIEELSRILQSLSQQLALGRETVRITTRLPTLRAYDLGCAVCGRGNREGARFCQGCGAPLNGQPLEGTAVAQPKPVHVRIAHRTDTGRVRRNNQDSVYADTLRLPDGTVAYLCLVADGMGGARAGEQASKIASQATQAQVSGTSGYAPDDDAAWQTLLRNATTTANRKVYEQSRSNADQSGMGTTLTVALIVGERVHLASVGDSRAYLFNAAGLTTDGGTSAQLTSDHSLVARLVDIGQITPEEARTHPQRNVLYRSIGTDPAVEVDTRSEQLGVGDVLLLCSDGLFNYVTDQELASHVLNQPDLDATCARLIQLANERGGADNISVVLVRIEA